MAHALFPRPPAHETRNGAEVDSVLEEDQAAGAKAKLPKLGQEAFREIRAQRSEPGQSVLRRWPTSSFASGYGSPSTDSIAAITNVCQDISRRVIAFCDASYRQPKLQSLPIRVR